jgi:hypothetical protein
MMIIGLEIVRLNLSGSTYLFNYLQTFRSKIRPTPTQELSTYVLAYTLTFDKRTFHYKKTR